MKTYKVKKDFDFNELISLGYSYSISEGAWFSDDGSTVVVELRSPYIRQISDSQYGNLKIKI